MKLRLKNFRCYLEKEIDFGEDGLLLLSGGSGQGKSSLMMAINFALYGTGTKLTTVGKTACSVELEFGDLSIKRTKRPNRLVVLNTKTNEEYEDEAGQGIINKRFGEAFDITSYVQQNATNSFILMSPLDKLSFLEKFAFQGVDLSKLKGKCSALIKQRNEELIATTSQLELATTYLKELKKPAKVPFPFRTKDKELAIKNETIRHKNAKTRIKKAEKALLSLTKELNDLKLYQVKLEAKTSSRSTVKQKIDSFCQEINSIEYEGDEALKTYEDQLRSVLSQRELTVLREKYSQDVKRLEEMQANETALIKKEIETVKNGQWKEYTSDELSSSLADYQQLVKDAEKLERLRSSLSSYAVNEDKLEENKKTLQLTKENLEEKKELLAKLLLQQEVYKCPSCHASLRFQDKVLRMLDEELSDDEEIDMDELKKEITTMNRIISKLEYLIPEEQAKLNKYREISKEISEIESRYEEEIPSKDEAESNIEYLKEYKRAQNELEKKRKLLEENLRNKEFSSSLKMFSAQVEKQKEAIKTLEADVKRKKLPEVNEEELRSTIQVQRRNKEKLENYEHTLKVLRSELSSLETSIKEIEEKFTQEYTETREISDVEEEIEQETKKLEEERINLKKHEENMGKIENYKKYQEENAKYTEWDKKVKDLTELETKNRQRYSAATMYKEKILEAESIAILNVIQSINLHAQEYLDLFFPDSPIVVRLMPFKTTKKKTTKPQINLEIDYKGMEADINMLSGGELSRVILAYTLALAEIFNSPLILLDECTASLDQELTTTVMEGIRTHFANKLVVCICHQVVSGSFDRQIAL